MSYPGCHRDRFGHLMFLAYINDLLDHTQSDVRLFADDALLNRKIASNADAVQLQRALSSLQHWEHLWQMEFHPQKCTVIHITNKRQPLKTGYTLQGHILEEVQIAKYLGVTIHQKLRWTEHISNIKTKVTRTLGFVKQRYFSESMSESVQNRCCRALANLALSAKACEVIHRTDVLSHLVLLLEQTKDKECIQTYCRATRLFGRTKDQRDKIVTKGAILQVAKQVSSEDTDIKKCSFEFSEQVVSAAAIKELVAIVIRDDSTEICQQSLQVLFELICHPNTRPVFGAAGGIQVFIDRFHTEESQNTRLSILNVLCLCTKESVNRAKLRTNGALILFLEALQNFECKILTTDNFEDCFNGESSWNFDSELFPEEDSIFHKFYPGEYSCSSEEISHENPENVVSQMTDCEFDNDQRNLYSIDSPTYTANKLCTLEDSDTLCKTNFSNDMTSMKSSSLSPLSTITYMSPEFSPTRPQFSSPSSPSCDFSGTSSTCHYPSVLSTPYSPIKSCHTSPISSPGLSPDSLSYSNNQEDLFSESEEEEDVIVGEHDIEEDMETGEKVTYFDPSITDVINQDNKETVAPTLSPHIKPNENVSNKNIQPECDCELPAFDVVGKSPTESSRSTEESQPTKRRRVAVSSESTSHIQDNSISAKKIQKSNSVTNRVSYKKERKEPTITENHILIILSRISHMDDPSKILVTKETICCLLDYIKNVDYPEKRAACILSRLIQNPLCFEKFLILNASLSVFFKLLYNEDDESIELNIQKLQTHVTSKRDQRRSVRSRSSSCSLESSDFLDVEDDNCRENGQSKPDKELSYGTDSGQLLKPSNEENLENEHFLISQTEDEGLRCTQDNHIAQENCRESLESSCSTLFEKEKMSIRSGLVFLHELSIQAESPFGRGVVAHLCHRKTEKEKLWMKITLLFMIWTKSSFKHYMMERGVLKDITHILLSTGNDAVEDLCSTSQYQVSLMGLCFLGHIIPKSTSLVGDRQSSMKSSVPYLYTVDALKPRFESETSGCHLRQTSRTNFALRIGNDTITGVKGNTCEIFSHI
ncbi:hypothetical protein FSP39_022881 [Pinctada imbricata]|uniref:ARMC5-like ARM-repeats domain-containing protein n=1 Tax=Pinctada imbricata TaxID=66713 RepID=A0AA89BRR6_PINIB|nr:hypothetical protein FSP39_022881 [Pinctada imbricata]